MSEKPLNNDLFATLAQQIEDCDTTELDRFLRQAADLLPSNCTPLVRQGELILECMEQPTAQKLWRDQSKLLDIDHAKINRFTILCGDRRHSISIEGLRHERSLTASPMNQSLAYIQNGCSYQQLLLKVANAQHPTFVVEMPKGWHWGQPQRVILTSAQVTGFSGRKAPNWHGDDVTLLYDRSELERIHSTLMQELEQTPGHIAQLNNFEYESYTVANDRESLFRDQKARYSSDLEVMYIPDLDMIVRVCYCKHREII